VSLRLGAAPALDEAVLRLAMDASFKRRSMASSYGKSIAFASFWKFLSTP
jgi:hypothetical protein